MLVNNAGVWLENYAPSQVELATLRATYETNVFGVSAVTRAMPPLLEAAPAGRIVSVSSALGSLTLNADPGWAFAPVKLLAYNSSKAALNMQTVLLAAELRDTAIKVNAAH